MPTIADIALLVLEFVADYVISVAALGLLVYTTCAITLNSQRLGDVLAAVSPAPLVGFLPANIGLKGGVVGAGGLASADVVDCRDSHFLRTYERANVFVRRDAELFIPHFRNADGALRGGAVMLSSNKRLDRTQGPAGRCSGQTWRCMSER